MRTKTISKQEELEEIIKKCQVCHVAMVDGEENPIWCR